MNKMNFVSCLYLNKNRSYCQKCVFDQFIDHDLDIDLIFNNFIEILDFICAYFCVKYLKSVTKTDTARDKLNIDKTSFICIKLKIDI